MTILKAPSWFSIYCVHLALADKSVASITCHLHLKATFDVLFGHILLEVA